MRFVEDSLPQLHFGGSCGEMARTVELLENVDDDDDASEEEELCVFKLLFCQLACMQVNEHQCFQANTQSDPGFNSLITYTAPLLSL